MKKISKLICFTIILFLALSMIGSYSNAAQYRPNANPTEPAFQIDIFDVNEPIVKVKPTFDYDYDEKYPSNYWMENLDFVYWLEFDESYEDMLSYMDDIQTFGDMMDYTDLVVRASVNRRPDMDRKASLMAASEMMGPMNRIPTIKKFEENKRYMAVFFTYFEYETVQQLEKSRTIKSQPIIPGLEPSNIVSSVNDQTENVRTIIEPIERVTQTEYHALGQQTAELLDTSRSFIEAASIAPTTSFRAATLALYDTAVRTQDYKATVNWIDATEDKIPDSFVLKLMNGETVVKEDTVNKADVANKTSWEHDFGEFPIYDENGNEINYSLSYGEAKEGDLEFYSTDINGFIIDNKYIPPELKSKIRMTSTINRETNNVKYKINYTASIKKYSGDAVALITATLPFEINESKSDLDGGIYDPETNTITWEEAINDINKSYNYSTTKNIDLYATAVLPYAIEAKSVGELTLEATGDYKDSVGTISSSTGNPKTDDIIKKYVSIGLVGLASIFMVVSIKRKYSTRKSKVQF